MSASENQIVVYQPNETVWLDYNGNWQHSHIGNTANL